MCHYALKNCERKQILRFVHNCVERFSEEFTLRKQDAKNVLKRMTDILKNCHFLLSFGIFIDSRNTNPNSVKENSRRYKCYGNKDPNLIGNIDQ